MNNDDFAGADLCTQRPWEGLNFKTRTALIEKLVAGLENNDSQAEQVTVAWLKEDSTALEVVERAYSIHLRRSLYRLAGGDQNQIEDWVQDTFVKLARAIGDFELDSSKGYFRSWVITCARNLALDWLRRETNRSRKQQAQLVNTGAGIQTEYIMEERSAFSLDLQAAMEKLENRYRVLLIMRYNYNLSYAEMAQLTGETERSIEYRLGLAKKQLKAALSEK